MDTLTVSEVFGPTFQGEGPSAGTRAMFVRLGGCNLDCQWCDTSYTWDWTGKNGIPYDKAKELYQQAPADLLVQLMDADCPLVVVTGGEPLIQRRTLAPFVSELLDRGYRVEVETNGTIVPVGMDEGCHFNVSPKLSYSGVRRAMAIKLAPIEAFLARRGVAWKFVVGTTDDLHDLDHFFKLYDPPRSRVWLMHQTAMHGVEPSLTDVEVADAALAMGCNFTGRMHVELWGNERGH